MENFLSSVDLPWKNLEKEVKTFLMAVRVAEYFGQKTEQEIVQLQPKKELDKCPFMEAPCVKLEQGQKPVCAVRRADEDIWIVCRHRLCATKNKIDLGNHQKDILLKVGKCIFGQDILEEDIAIKREVSIPVVGKSKYHADYIMINAGPRGRQTGQKRVVLEMQGGGETSNTGSISKNIEAWENNEERDNDQLRKLVKASPIVTNAWRRQQEQFIIKGNIAQQTGGGIVFCVGKPLYDYLWERVKNSQLNDLKDHNWTLALIAFDEKPTEGTGPLKFEIDYQRVFFTNYISFVQVLINQGNPNPAMFQGQFELLNGGKLNL